MSRAGDWLRGLRWRKPPPPPLPARVPPPDVSIPDWRAPWLLSAAQRLAADLGPGEEPQVLKLTVLARDGAYVALDIAPGEHWPQRSLLAADERGELRTVVVPDDPAGAEKREWE